VADHLRSVRADVLQRVGAGEAGIFDAHLLMVQDAELLRSALQDIELRRVNAEAGWQRSLQVMATRYRTLPDPYLARRAEDVLDVGQRVLRRLSGVGPDEGGPLLTQPSILVAHELKPSDLARVQPEMVLGIVTELGSASDHSAILARALGLPAVTGVGPFLGQVENGQTLALDGSAGCVWLAPTADQLQELEQKGEAWAKERAAVQQSAQRPAATRDGRRILVGANINGPSDVAHALNLGAEGVGLFRTEYLFLDRVSPPSEEEQLDTYRLVARQLKGKPLIVRTLDVGGDKPLPYIRSEHEANPFLGRRGLRYSLDRPAIFKQQLRAILRASRYGKIRLLIPMLSQAHEIDQTLAAIERAKASLRGEAAAFDEAIEVGAMIEIPAAALAVGLFLRRMHFLSIGTNDLIQYTLAIDRSDEQVAPLYDPLHPAVLMLLAHTIASAEKVNVPVSICGELAGDPSLTRLLLGMGLRQFSMHPAQIVAVKQTIMQSNCAELAPIVRRLLRHEEPAKIREQLAKLNG